MFSKRVAVLMGGKSAEREVSLRTGARVIGALEVREVSVVVIDPIDSDWLNQLLSVPFILKRNLVIKIVWSYILFFRK